MYMYMHFYSAHNAHTCIYGWYGVVLQALVSLKRISDFLQLEEIDSDNVQHDFKAGTYSKCCMLHVNAHRSHYVCPSH